MPFTAAPVLRGSFKDSFPSDLRELATWFNRRLPDRHRPLCSVCQVRCRVVYGTASHQLFWGCKQYRACGQKPQPGDEPKLYAYAKRRLSHHPSDCRTERTMR